ncbi:MAG: hypothetical protein IT580_02750 [Verrucomicrobiales bacterium]|nr:hypothetical protein [Verrucomicrobiales bacterium]
MTLATPHLPDGVDLDREDPWPGLASFTERNALYFQGRATEAEELFRLVRRDTLTVLFGQSGLGKSSLLQAGLFPRLRQEGFSPIYLRLDHQDPRASLIEQVRDALRVATNAVPLDLGLREGETLWETFQRRSLELTPTAAEPVPTPPVPVLVFDQFEESFTLGQDRPERRRQLAEFLGQLADLVENRLPDLVRVRLERGTSRVAEFDFDKRAFKVVLALREDYLAHLETACVEHDLRTPNRMRLLPLDGRRALEVVLKPGLDLGLMSSEVAARVVAFAGGCDLAKIAPSGEEGQLPAAVSIEPSLLSLLCQRLNERRKDRGLPAITDDLFAGTRDTVLREFYEGSFSPRDRALRRYVEEDLLTESGHRDNADYEDAVARAGVTEEGLKRLINRRLIRKEERGGRVRVELIHDVLARVAVASRDSRRRGREHQRRFLVILGVLMALGMVLVANLLRQTIIKGKEADAERQRARRHLSDYLSLWVARSLERGEPEAAWVALLRAAEMHAPIPHADAIASVIPPPIAEPLARLDALPTAVRKVGFVPDGSGVIALDTNGVLTLVTLDPSVPGTGVWNLGEGVSTFTVGGPAPGILVVGLTNSEVQVRQLADRQVLARFRPPDSRPAIDAAPLIATNPISPTGLRVLVGPSASTNAPGSLSTNETKADEPVALAISRDGMRVFAGYRSGLVRAGQRLSWPHDTTAEVLEFAPLVGPAAPTSLAIIPASDSPSPQPSGAVPVSTNAPAPHRFTQIRDLFLLRDDTLLLVATPTGVGKLSVIRLANAALETTAGGLADAPDSMDAPFAIDALGRHLAAVDPRLRTLRHLELSESKPPGDWTWSPSQELRAPAGSIAVSRDGRLVAAGLRDGSVEIWDNQRRLQRLPAHQGPVNAVAFGPDHRTLVTFGEPFAKLWRLEPNRELALFHPGTRDDGREARLMIHPAGRSLVAGTLNKRDLTYSWDLTSGLPHPPLPRRLGDIIIGITPTGRTIWASETAQAPENSWLTFTQDDPARPVIGTLTKSSLTNALSALEASADKDLGQSRDISSDLVVIASPTASWLGLGFQPGFLMILWTDPAGITTHQVLGPVGTELVRLIPSADGRRLAVVHSDAIARLWDLEPWNFVASVPVPAGSEGKVFFGPTPELLTWPDPDDSSRLLLVDIRNGRNVGSIPALKDVGSVAFLSESNLTAFASVEGEIHVRRGVRFDSMAAFEAATGFGAIPESVTNEFSLQPLPIGTLRPERELEIFPEISEPPIDPILGAFHLAWEEAELRMDRRLRNPLTGFSNEELSADLEVIRSFLSSHPGATDPQLERGRQWLRFAEGPWTNATPSELGHAWLIADTSPTFLRLVVAMNQILPHVGSTNELHGVVLAQTVREFTAVLGQLPTPIPSAQSTNLLDSLWSMLSGQRGAWNRLAGLVADYCVEPGSLPARELEELISGKFDARLAETKCESLLRDLTQRMESGGQPGRAVTFMSRLATLQGTNAAAWQKTADVARQASQLDTAGQAYLRAAQAQSATNAAVRTALLTAAAQAWFDIPSRRADAESALSEALVLDPLNLDARLLRGRLRHYQSQFDTAEQDLNEVLNASPTNGVALVFRGAGRLAIQDRSAGLADLDAAARWAPGSWDVWGRRGWALLNSGYFSDLPAAAQAFESGLQVVRSSGQTWPWASDNQGVALMRLGQVEKAIPVLQRGIQDDTNHVWLRADLGIALAVVGRTNEARIELDRAVTILDPYNFRGLEARAVLHLLENRPAEALTDLDAAVQRSTFAKRARARLRLAQGDAAGAVTDFEEAPDRDAISADDRFLYAAALAQVQRLEEARAEWQRLATMSPSNPPLWRVRALARARLRDLDQARADALKGHEASNPASFVALASLAASEVFATESQSLRTPLPAEVRARVLQFLALATGAGLWDVLAIEGDPTLRPLLDDPAVVVLRGALRLPWSSRERWVGLCEFMALVAGERAMSDEALFLPELKAGTRRLWREAEDRGFADPKAPPSGASFEFLLRD